MYAAVPLQIDRNRFTFICIVVCRAASYLRASKTYGESTSPLIDDRIHDPRLCGSVALSIETDLLYGVLPASLC